MRQEDRETIKHFIEVAKKREEIRESKWEDVDRNIKLGIESLKEDPRLVQEILSKPEIREKQIEIGKYISQQKSKIDVAPAQEEVLEKKKTGRPSLGDEKSKKITIWLKNEDLLFLKNELGDSYGDKTKSIINELSLFREREKNQIRFLQSLLKEISVLLDSYVRKFGRSEYYQDLNKIIDEVSNKGANILNFLKIFGIKEEDFSKRLSKEENREYLLMKDLMMKIYYDKSKQ